MIKAARHVFLVLLAAVAGCSCNPVDRALRLCADCAPLTLQSEAGFPLQSYQRNIKHPLKRLHIYLEGDGQPWINGRYPAANPTSRQLTVLKLMKLDPAPAAYINRPCYGHRLLPPACETSLWTAARYSETVVSALDAAISELKSLHNARELVLFGHSGGGSLAMLIAGRRRDVRAVITAGANLDVAEWANMRGFLPLSESLNPAELKMLPGQVLRWHYAGTRDIQVPAAITEQVAEDDPYSRYFEQANFDHTCCWGRIWPAMLRDLSDALAAQDARYVRPSGTK